MTPIRPYRGICLSSEPGTIPVEAPPRLTFPVKILDNPMPIERASASILAVFPGIQINYLFACLAAMICGEVGGGQPPAVTATGPSGSGKGETVNIAASFLGDTVVKMQLSENPEAFMRQMGSSTAAGHRALMFDEFGKIKGIHEKMSSILQINSRITYRALYHTGMVTIPFRSALFYPCVRFPDFLRTSPEFLRRTRGVHLPAKVPNWRASSGGDAAETGKRIRTAKLFCKSVHESIHMATMPKGSERLVPLAFRVTPGLQLRIRELLLEYKGKPHFLTSHAFAEISLELGIQYFESKYKAEDEGKWPFWSRRQPIWRQS